MALFETRKQNLVGAAVFFALTVLGLAWFYSRRGDMDDDAFGAFVRAIATSGSGASVGLLLRAFLPPPSRWFKRFEGTFLGTDVTKFFRRK
jgi:hypothetical protein